MNYKIKPVEDHRCLQAIWKILYLVEVPEMYLREEEDIRARGTFTTGDPDKDMKVQSSYSRTYLTINDIFELWRQGVNVYVVKYEDTEKIYNAISEHLTNWLNFLSQGIGISHCPFNDLLELDQFANAVYDKAKFVFTQASTQSIRGALSTLGFSMNPADFKFNSKKSYRYNHLVKSEKEKQQELDPSVLHYHERKGLEGEILDIARRFDAPLDGEQKGYVPLPFEVKFGNES